MDSCKCEFLLVYFWSVRLICLAIGPGDCDAEVEPKGTRREI